MAACCGADRMDRTARLGGAPQRFFLRPGPGPLDESDPVVPACIPCPGTHAYTAMRAELVQVIIDENRTNLGFLNQTARAALLTEICFVDSRADVELYRRNFDAICEALARALVDA